MTLRGRTWIVSAAATSVIVTAAAVIGRILAVQACCGEFVYPIDDTYIHLAMAGNLAENGVWGVRPDEMAFCSSSPLWTLLLAGLFCLTGVTEVVPWVVALVCNLASLVVVCRFLSANKAGPAGQFFGAMAVAMAGPFTCTTALGMEHAMHAFFMLSTAAAVWKFDQMSLRGTLIACALAAAAAATRYESLFLLLPIGGAFVRWRFLRPGNAEIAECPCEVWLFCWLLACRSSSTVSGHRLAEGVSCQTRCC